jgi:hypothetical protein
MTHDPNHARHSAVGEPSGHRPRPTDTTPFENKPFFERRMEGTYGSAPTDKASRAYDDALMRCYNG